MLTLQNITKVYTTGAYHQEALAGVSASFEAGEFVAVLGQSGSGKTTLLNIIGGLDRYDSGDLIINGKSTKQFRDVDWDAYRNNSVGFVFQSYNLISHISVLRNVEMGMTLSGVPARERTKRALEALDRVGLRDHAKKKPNQLSGGQMQRVAIARALANKPHIILADEPTGALDRQTSIQTMDLIKDMSRDHLVIMVTHNPEIAEKYATRIIKLEDGKIISDSAPKQPRDASPDYVQKRTAMSFWTALKLSFHNIMTKKGRTALTAFASSIGIIGIALIMALSNGFDVKINEMEQSMLTELPIIISQQAMTMDEDTMKKYSETMQQLISTASENNYPDTGVLYPTQPQAVLPVHTNVISDDYVQYLESADPSLVAGISYTRMATLNLLRQDADGVKNVSAADLGLATSLADNASGYGGMSALTSSLMSSFTMVSSLPKTLGAHDTVRDNYDVLAGAYATAENELMLVVDRKNRLEASIVDALGLDGNAEEIKLTDVVGKTFVWMPNDVMYQPQDGMRFAPVTDYAAAAADPRCVRLTVKGVLRVKENSQIGILNQGLVCTSAFMDLYVDSCRNSAVVKAQSGSIINVLTGLPMLGGEVMRTAALMNLGGVTAPYAVMVFPAGFAAKDTLMAYLDAYNTGKPEEETVLYTDMSEMITSMSSGILDAITIVLVAFSSIALVVSVIMIGIIMYISVLERTREIGVLRALGARKKDVTRVFNAETFIVGLFSGTLGIAVAYLLTIPANIILYHLSDLEGLARLNPLHALALVMISLLLTMLGGFIPAKMASRRDPVISLRAE